MSSVAVALSPLLARRPKTGRALFPRRVWILILGVYAALVILVLLFRPEGFLPRRLRDYLPGRSLKSAP